MRRYGRNCQPVDHRFRPHRESAREFRISGESRRQKRCSHHSRYHPGRGPSLLQHLGNQRARGVNISIPVFNGFLYNARAKTADLQTELARQRLADLRNNVARDVRISWQDTNRAYERLSVTQQLREQASLALDLAQARYNLGLGSIVEFSQAELGKTEADIADADARYQYRLTQIVLAYTVSAPK
jgi:outer membrane protein TolC